MQRNFHSGLIYTSGKILISFQLYHGRTSVILICPCKMSKHTFDLKIWKFGNLFNFFYTFRCICKTDSGHSCVQRNMDMYSFILQNRFFGKLLRLLILAHCRTDIITDKFRIKFVKNNSKDQDWFCNPGFTQMNCLFCSCNCKSPDIIIILDQMRDRYCAVSVSISLYNCDHLCIFCNILSHFPEIMLYSIQ